MELTNVHLYRAVDAENGYALFVGPEERPSRRAERGRGAEFKKVWTVEVQSETIPQTERIDWDAVLERVVEAYDLNDPVLTDFHWPLRIPATQSRG